MPQLLGLALELLHPLLVAGIPSPVERRAQGALPAPYCTHPVKTIATKAVSGDNEVGRRFASTNRYHAFDQEAGYQRQTALTPDEIDQRILELARQRQVLRRRYLLKALGLEANQATHALQRLCKRGALTPEGVGKGRTYLLPPAV